MKQITNTFLLLSALVGCSFTTAQAATLTSTGNVQLDSATGWSPSQTPSSGNDTLSIGHNLSIDSTWTIGSGQAMTWTAGNWRFAQGGHLTVASGGTLTADGIYETGATATRSLTIEAGATATTRRYFSGNSAVTGGDSGWTTKWIADTSGVTTFNITADYRIRGGSIEVDLSSYDISNGTTLILADYGTLLDGPYFAVTLTSGWTGTVDFTYDQGGGDLAVALTNIVAPLPLITSTTTNGVFNVPATWVGGVVPVSSTDSVVLASVVTLTSDFIIGNGQSLTAATTSGLLSLGAGHLTVATGGTLDLVTVAANMTESGAGGHFTIEPAAIAKVDRYWNDETSPSYINEWIADADGVTTFEVAGSFALRGTNSELRVDLSNYDTANGDTLVLASYGNLALQNQAAGDNGWATITLTAGWSADLDLTTGNEIRLINIVAPSLPITWDNSGTGNWTDGTKWVGDVAPVTGDGKDVDIDFGTGNYDVNFNTTYTVESGQTLESGSRQTGFHPELAFQVGSHLTLATGGTIDLAFMRPRATAAFTIEAGATLNTDIYGLAIQRLDITYEADAVGVTTWNNSGVFDPRLDHLILDLSSYDTANGGTLVLVDYGTLGADYEFASVSMTEGWSGTIDYVYDTDGNGDLAIALTNIQFGADPVTSNGTLESWLDLYSLVTSGDYEAADLLDSDSDGRLNWEEYQDGTDPTGVGVAAPIAFTLVDATDGSADMLTFSAPDTTWVIEASTDNVEWGVVPQVSFVVNADGSITATVPQLATLNPGGTYRVVETSENTKLVIFLTEGQSNMVGWSSKTSYEMDDYPTPNMFQQSRGQARGEYDPGAVDSVVRAFQPFQTTQHRSGSTTGNYVSLDFYFARAYAKDHPDEDVLIVKNAIGGSGFVTNQWNAGDSLDVLADPYLAAALAEVSGEYATIEFGGILWHQGEADAATAASAAAYASNLTALFARHRVVVSSHFSVTQAPVIIGTMVPANIADNSTGYYDDIDAIHRDISNLVANAKFADLSGIVGEAGQHFLADGYQTAGEIYYDTWLAMQDMVTWVGDNNLTGNDALPGSNPDSDGLSNLLEFAFGTDPTVSNGGSIGYSSGVVTPGLPLPVLETISSNNVDFRAVFARRKAWAAAGLTYTPQFSPDLTEWVDVTAAPTLIESGSGDIEAVYVPYPMMIETTTGWEKPQFFRLSVSQD